jgi:AcrR family transcriptional regulator
MAKAAMSELTRGELLKRARAAFAEFGYAEAPIEAVTTAAGMTKGALYHHFGSKQGLFLAVARELAKELGQLFKARYQKKPTLSGFIQACHDFLLALIEPGPKRILIIDAQSALNAEQLSELDLEFGVSVLAEVLADLAQRGEALIDDLEAQAHLANGALTGLALWAALDRHPQRAIKRGLKLFARHFQPKQSGAN